MSKKLPGIVAIVCVLLLTGCLEFAQQTLSYRYDVKTDTLRIFQAYQGIFGEDKQDGLSDKELDQLQSVLSGQRTFFFANWIWEYDRESMRKELDNLNKPDTPQDTKRDPATHARQAAFFKLLLDNVRVENGPFYLDGQGRLCGIQFVTVKRFSKLVAAANEQIRDLLKLEAGRENVSAEDRALYLKFAGQRQPYITVKGNQLTVRFPLTGKEYEKSFGPATSAAKQMDELKQWGDLFVFADNEMKWSIGTPSDQTTVRTLSVSEKPYIPNALEAVKSRAIVHEKMDIAAAAKAFVQGTPQERTPPKP